MLQSFESFIRIGASWSKDVLWIVLDVLNSSSMFHSYDSYTCTGTSGNICKKFWKIPVNVLDTSQLERLGGNQLERLGCYQLEWRLQGWSLLQGWSQLEQLDASWNVMDVINEMKTARMKSAKDVEVCKDVGQWRLEVCKRWLVLVVLVLVMTKFLWSNKCNVTTIFTMTCTQKNVWIDNGCGKSIERVYR